MEDVTERRSAELEFVSAVYSPTEAWVVCQQADQARADGPDSTDEPTVIRRLATDDPELVSFLLELKLSLGYPGIGHLEIAGTVEDDKTASHLRKAAHNALPDLLQSCRETATAMPGEEAIFSVLSRADDWLVDQWPAITKRATSRTVVDRGTTPVTKEEVILCRNLIYSHHIIGKTKRADMKSLGSELNLTGYVKIGWPGIIIVEGEEHAVHAFYDTIRRWQWQYLVLRGEMREELAAAESVDSKRKFSSFLEVDSMSLVATHCRDVGLASLFLTSMKVYNTADASGNDDGDDPKELSLHGALVLVDHMNNAKAYRKWLRKTCSDLDVALLLKQCYPNDDYSKRPLILVGLVGSKSAVSAVLKRYRTTKVDIDSRGKPCLERMMTVLCQGVLTNANLSSGSDWDDLNSEGQLNTTKAKLLDLMHRIGGEAWIEALDTLR